MFKTFKFAPEYARRIPDPNFKAQGNAERHLFVMGVKSIPAGIGLDPNARRPNISKRVYRKVEASLLQQDESPKGTFHLKNKGITIIASSVKQLGDRKYEVVMESGFHGIVDGGHTYQLIIDNKENPDLADDQYVFVEVRVGIPNQWIPEIAGGLNTSVQVQDMSLDHLAGRFNWLKDLLKSEPYYNTIAWSENDKGDYDARDIISMMLCFNVALYPNDQEEHPIAAYERKSTALKLFEEKYGSFKRMKPILKDILRFHDIVGKQGRELYNRLPNTKGGSLAFVDQRKRGKYSFHFTDEQDYYRLAPGALYPMMAAFRWYVEDDSMSGTMKWRGGFPSVVKTWNELGGELMRATMQTSNELGRNPQSIGKSRNHWSNLHSRVIKHDLMHQQRPIAELAE